MANSLMMALGQQFGYFKTILESRVELAQLEVADVMSKVMSQVVVLGVVFITGFLSLFTFLALGGVVIYQYTESIYLSIGLIGFLLAMLTLVVYIRRKKLFYNSISDIIFEILNEKGDFNKLKDHE